MTTLQGHTNVVYSVKFSPDGRLLASGSGDRSVRLWNVETGECCQVLNGHLNEIWATDFSPDGQLIASSSEDEMIKLWQVKTGKCWKILRASRPCEGMNITGVMG